LAHNFSPQVSVTEFDRQLLRRFNQNLAVSLVPNGVDTDYFEFRPPPKSESPSIVFVGSMNYQPNIDGMRYFVDEIYPYLQKQNPHLMTYVVGRDPTPEVKRMGEGDHLIVTGTVEDIRHYLYRSTLSICPIRIGGGTRLKILESMAAGRPVVSTSAGADGLPCDHGVNILLSDRPEEFADHVSTLISDADLCQRLATNGRRFVEDHFHWASISRKLLLTYEQAMGEYNIASRVN
jgi:glycosyltransferase involved in cell wall biosynthesis